ncbi:MAG: hypothetical protein HY787_04020 [Deltaproteobacteria bacterium]|nr:hypothetical protein [Deltaproteobacteria bacterium]
MKEKLDVPLLRFLARRLAQTKFGQKALSQPGNGLSILKQRPGPRVYLGLALMTISCLTGLPALAFLGYLSVKVNRVMIIAAGAPVIFLLVHIVFGVGVYLAGQNYAKETLLWATKRFLQKFA